MALSALDCTLHGERAIYASSELTTGRRLFAVLSDYNLSHVEALKKKLGKKGFRQRILEPNIVAAAKFAQNLRGRLGTSLVVTPAPFVAPRWDQLEYLTFWEAFIRTRTAAVYFNDHWQFSNGCTFEFLIAKECAVSCHSASGSSIHLESGIHMISSAVAELESSGIGAEELRKTLRSLEILADNDRTSPAD